MTDSKEVFVFGSFTKEDVSLFKTQPSASQPMEKKELQFGSLDAATISSVGCFKVEHKQDDISKEVKNVNSPNPTRKENPLKSVNTTNDEQRRVFASIAENGNDTSSSSCPPLVNGVVERTSADISSLCISQTTECAQEQSISDLEYGIETVTSFPEGINAVDSSEGLSSKQDTLKVVSNGPAASFKALLPRGLINSGNLCFLNASLQALLSCSPFVQLLQELRAYDIPKIGYPTLHAFIEFISHFDTADTSSKKSQMVVTQTGMPFIPAMFEPVLKNFTPDVPNSVSGRPRQEDAQEFLCFVMDQMHDEVLKRFGQVSNTGGGNFSTTSPSEDEGWETVGPKNKSAVTRTQSLVPSKISEIFGGQLRSVVKSKGNKDSATIQPFLLLHLDIFSGSVRTVEDALRLFSSPETLEGYKTSAAGKAASVSASKSIKIQATSKIMILHLMRFSYGSRGSTKLHKPVRFPLELVLGRELLASSLSEGRRYELFATITHHGKEPSKGHYTADTRCSDGKWLRYDDASVTAVAVNKVLHDQAYLLFYKQV
ncbi:hypothetical protein C5167_001813 [Papaver somniferum]|uniref:Ubiquitin carboxyl-terminal hydrolase n=1 Tax=Papaver somniferum TaxID=3469 RepID=A0A4Y7KWC5_PAPSO|nr:ubiquitin carboxyl-terminal hydrolase 24-like [Papaver somniferum]RZC77634.1 hypothetical protein C5167_001813 [Papaver somniferum]